MRTSALLPVLFASLLLTGCGSDTEVGAGSTTGGTGNPDDVQTGLAIAPTATLHGQIPAGLVGTVSVIVDGQPATIIGTTWSATIPVPAAQAQVELRVDDVVVERRQVAVKR